jgi:hypothetical protein
VDAPIPDCSGAVTAADPHHDVISADRSCARQLASSGVLGVVYLAGGFAVLGEPEKIIVLDVRRCNEAVCHTFKKHFAGGVVGGDFGVISPVSDQSQ